MDPNATLKMILDNLGDMDDSEMSRIFGESLRLDTIEGLRDLAYWLEKGGFAPDPKKYLDS